MKRSCNIKIELRTEADGEVYVEVPWATPCGHENHFKLLNHPFYAYGVSWGDIVEATPCLESERPIFARVVEKSGHRLVRVLFDPPIDEAPENQAHLDAITGLGCAYVGANPSFFCIDIPPGVTLSDITDYLILHDLQWEHADPPYSTLYPND